ncbi:hypothetical protein BD414DRAFT_490345 [Trametes punicea]|nr:hypothetical protein BD414DRAFT_490345 [Trametes punicea]
MRLVVLLPALDLASASFPACRSLLLKTSLADFHASVYVTRFAALVRHAQSWVRPPTSTPLQLAVRGCISARTHTAQLSPFDDRGSGAGSV